MAPTRPDVDTIPYVRCELVRMETVHSTSHEREVAADQRSAKAISNKPRFHVQVHGRPGLLKANIHFMKAHRLDGSTLTHRRAATAAN